MLKQITITAPSAWASYLINGDSSGLEDEDIKACDKWIEREGVGGPCSCEDAGFIKWHDAYNEMPLAADCQEYLFLYEEPPELPVIFKREGDSVIAFFPTLPDTANSMICYAHVGQHSGASFGYFRSLKPATPAEYEPLLKELKGIYERGKMADQSRLVVKKRSSTKMMAAFRKALTS